VVSTVLWHQSEFLQFPQAWVPAQYCKVIHQDQRVALEIFQAGCDNLQGFLHRGQGKCLLFMNSSVRPEELDVNGFIDLGRVILLLLKLVWRG